MNDAFAPHYERLTLVGIKPQRGGEKSRDKFVFSLQRDPGVGLVSQLVLGRASLYNLIHLARKGKKRPSTPQTLLMMFEDGVAGVKVGDAAVIDI